MARRRRNKSEAVRQVLAENPQASVKEVVTLLGQRGIKVRPTLIYFIRSRQRHVARRQKRRQAVANGAPTYSAELILQVKTLAKDAGGFRNLKQLVEVLGD
jgi:hypothetical protein